MGRRKKRNRKSVDEAEVPLSSMIDVVFLLLIYFIVTQKPIIEDTYLAVDLPAPDGKPKPNQTPPTLFTIDVMKRRIPNQYHVNGKPWMFDQLKNLLKTQADNDPDTTVIINCGPNAKHKKLIKLLDACAEAGLKKLNLVNDESVRFVPEH